MRVRLTATSLEWLGDHKIFFHSKGYERLKSGDPLSFRNGCEVEPYIGVYVGNVLCPLGFMSFSNSALSPKLTVGRYCSIAHAVELHLAGHPVDHISSASFTHDAQAGLVRSLLHDLKRTDYLPAEFETRPPPMIEHDVWIGARASLLPGITVRTGAIVAANSVVTRDVGPYEIVAGNPARLVRKRFSEELISALLASQWWLYRFTDFAGLPFDDPSRFVEGFMARKADLEPYRPALIPLDQMPRTA